MLNVVYILYIYRLSATEGYVPDLEVSWGVSTYVRAVNTSSSHRNVNNQEMDDGADEIILERYSVKIGDVQLYNSYIFSEDQ